MSYLFDLLRASWHLRDRLSRSSTTDCPQTGAAVSERPRSSLFPFRFKGIEHPDVLVMIVECLQPGLAPDVAARLDNIRKLVPDSKNRQLEIWTNFIIPNLGDLAHDLTLPLRIRQALSKVYNVYTNNDPRFEWRILQMEMWLMFSQVICSRRGRGIYALNKPVAALALAYFCAAAGMYLHQIETPEVPFPGLVTMKDAVFCYIWATVAIDQTWSEEDNKALAASGDAPTPFKLMCRWSLFRQEFFGSYSPATSTQWNLNWASAVYKMLAQQICHVCQIKDVT